MNLLFSLIKEIVGMFVADALLTGATLVLIGLTACLKLAGFPSIACGVVLLVGAMLVVTTTVIRAAIRHKANRRGT